MFLNAPRSIFDSVGFKTEHFFRVCSPKKIAVDDQTNDSPKTVEEDEEGDMEVELEFSFLNPETLASFNSPL